MTEPKYPSDLKIRLAKEYLSGDASYRFLAFKYRLGKKSAEDRTKKYREHGGFAFVARCGNQQHKSSFKTNCEKQSCAAKAA